MSSNTFYITTPIYYVNASPHLGHAYTTILADSIMRINKLLGKETFFLTGTDEHGDKIVQAAREKGISPKEYVDKISNEFRELWIKFKIGNDYFIRTTDPKHKACVQKILNIVYEKGDIYFGEYGGYYCFGCERFYTEKELVDGKCPDHQKEPEYIYEQNYFFRLSKYQDWLKTYIEKNPDFIQPEGFRKEVLALLREPLDDLCISRPKKRLTWGIELPFDSNYVTYVWFDALINYISALDWPDGEKFKKFWPNAYHLIAKDILKPHAIFWPCMLKSAGIPLFKGLRVHGYWKVNEAKMSKSLGNVVSPLEMAEKYGLDGFRYFLLREMRFGFDGNFSEESLVNRFNSDLANDLGNLFNRSLSMTHKYFDGYVPKPHEYRGIDEEIIEFGKKAMSEYIEDFTNFNTSIALERLWEFIRRINKYIDQTAPWTLYKNKEISNLKTVISVVLTSLKKIAIFLWPVMPDASELMLKQLGLNLDITSVNLKQEISDWTPLDTQQKVASRSNIFPRVEKVRFEEDKEESKKTEKTVSFKDFQKISLKIGVIKEAQKVPNADKLLLLKVDVGEKEPRDIVAGIAEFYDPKDLINKEVVVVTNLEPKKIRGYISHGMILAARDKKGLALLTVDKDVSAGSPVS